MSKSSETAAGVLAIFGISGDLAKKMTFRALYRLEVAGKLGCPIVGVAIDEWDDEALRRHAREAIEATVEEPDEVVLGRLADRLTGMGAQLLVVPVVEGDADDRHLQDSRPLHPVERPEGHFLRQVAADAEDRQHVGCPVDVSLRPPRHLRGRLPPKIDPFPASSADQEDE